MHSSGRYSRLPLIVASVPGRFSFQAKFLRPSQAAHHASGLFGFLIWLRHIWLGPTRYPKRQGTPQRELLSVLTVSAEELQGCFQEAKDWTAA